MKKEVKELKRLVKLAVKKPDTDLKYTFGTVKNIVDLSSVMFDEIPEKYHIHNSLRLVEFDDDSHEYINKNNQAIIITCSTEINYNLAQYYMTSQVYDTEFYDDYKSISDRLSKDFYVSDSCIIFDPITNKRVIFKIA